VGVPLPFLLFATPDGNEGRFQLAPGRYAVGRSAAAFTLTSKDAPLRAGVWEVTEDGAISWTASGGTAVRCVDGFEVRVLAVRMEVERQPRGPMVRIAPATGGLGDWLRVDLRAPFEPPPAPRRPAVASRGQLVLIAALAVVAGGLTVANQVRPGVVVIDGGSEDARGAAAVVQRTAPERAATETDQPVPPTAASERDRPELASAPAEPGVAEAPPRPEPVARPSTSAAAAPANHDDVVVYAYESVDGELSYRTETFVILDDGGSDIAYQTETRQLLWETKEEHQACFSALRSAQPGARGVMWLDVLVGEGGEVTDGFVIPEESTLLDDATVECVLDEVRRVDFREPPAPPFEFAYPLVLSLGMLSVPPPPG